jgi:hypothetical protein
MMHILNLIGAHLNIAISSMKEYCKELLILEENQWKTQIT